MASELRLPLLRSLSVTLEVPLDEQAIERFDRFRALLLEWNEHTNLTRITNPEEVELKLFVDALALWPLVERYRRQHPKRERLAIVDLGAGAGFPGIPLKIARPEIDLVLIEATGKKVAFMQSAIEALGLTGVRSIHGRSEELARQPELRGRFDIAMARALARLPALIELCMPFSRVGGWGIFPKGKDAQLEAREARTALKRLRARLIDVSPATITELAGTSTVVVEQFAPAPAEFPRRTGMPAKSPL